MNLELAITPQLKLTPQMLQSARILQMGALELQEYLVELAADNPLIEVAPFDEGVSNLPGWRMAAGGRMSGPEDRLLHAVPGPAETMQDNLQLQLETMIIPREEKAAALYLVYCLNEDGYLDIPLEDAAARLGIGEEEAMHALKRVQSLEPHGVGARSLRECLLLQLEHSGKGTPLIERIVEECLDLLGRNRLDAISRKLGAGLQEVKNGCVVIRSLNPRPGSLFGTGGPVPYAIPDIRIVKSEGAWRAVLSETSPSFSISGKYSSLLKAPPDEETGSYLARKFKQATWIRQCMAERNRTLVRTAEAIASLQPGYFEHGPHKLSPMSLRTAAELLQVHESTVSRAIRDKYLECSWGVVAISSLFTHALQSGDDSSAVTPELVKHRIRILIEQENKSKPLSDQQLSELLGLEGIHAARRTVAKYREELLLPAAAGRKAY